MNSANLQLEGLYLAIAAVNEALVTSGALSRTELETALKSAEQAVINDDRAREDMGPSERDTLAFPARLLLLASAAHGDDGLPGFTELARRVGKTKQPYNDQR